MDHYPQGFLAHAKQTANRYGILGYRVCLNVQVTAPIPCIIQALLSRIIFVHVLGVGVQELLLERSHESIILVLFMIKPITERSITCIPQEMRDSMGVQDIEMFPYIHL